MAELIIIPAIIIGALIGFYELILIHKDENFRGSHWLTHGLHAAFFAVIFTFASMNVDFVKELLPFLDALGIFGSALMIRLLIGVLAVFKIQAASAVVRGGAGVAARGLREHFIHTVIVASLIVLVPYIYPYIEPLFPEFLK
ncbi:hypothetical protein HYX18_01835 [Candidatus Woesearchaeota archaeon]|nr:hypothetical protein [Candidatus Woesearchaeota archaeon]